VQLQEIAVPVPTTSKMTLHAVLDQNQDKNISMALPIDIERKNRLLKVFYVPTTSATFLAFFLSFLLWPLTVLMKQTRQVVCNSLYYLYVYGIAIYLV
jgi:hypothetical protein